MSISLLVTSNLFQLTTSQGGRRFDETKRSRYRSFNSRPHKEVDRPQPLDRLNTNLSTHDLTRRSTYLIALFLSLMIPFNSRPHKEVDCRVRIICQWHFPFNSRPHKEVDASFTHRPLFLGSFNSRPHKEVDESYTLNLPRYVPFNSRPHKEVDRYCQAITL